MDKLEKPKKKKKKAKKKSVSTAKLQGPATAAIPVSKGSKLTPALSQDGHYIYVLEGTIGRLDLKNNPHKNIIGLCTDNFTSCNILIFISKDRTKYVLIHADQSLVHSFENKIIDEQIRWIGDEPLLVNCHRDDSGDPSQSSAVISNRLLQYSMKKRSVPQKIEAVMISFDTLEPKLEESLPTNVLHHPNSARLFACHSINTKFQRLPASDTESYATPLIFDCADWTRYLGVKLSDSVVRELALGKITETSSFRDLLDFFLKKNPVLLEQGERWHMVNERNVMSSANLLIYYYLQQATKPEPEGFLRYSFRHFGYKEKEVLIGIILSKRKDFSSSITGSKEEIDFVASVLTSIKGTFSNDIAYYSSVPIRAYFTIFERFKLNSSGYLSKKEDEKSEKLSSRSSAVIQSSSSSSTDSSTTVSTPRFYVPSKTVSIHQKARESYSKKDYDVAYEKYQKLLICYETAQNRTNQTTKNQARAYFEMGDICVQLKKMDEALENFEKAKEFDPSNDIYIKRYNEYNKSREEINSENELS